MGEQNAETHKQRRANTSSKKQHWLASCWIRVQHIVLCQLASFVELRAAHCCSVTSEKTPELPISRCDAMSWKKLGRFFFFLHAEYNYYCTPKPSSFHGKHIFAPLHPAWLHHHFFLFLLLSLRLRLVDTLLSFVARLRFSFVPYNKP